MKEIEIEALRPFNKTPQGELCEVGDTFPVDATRADELVRLGLARRTDGKAAPVPDNKMRPARSTKAVKVDG